MPSRTIETFCALTPAKVVFSRPKAFAALGGFVGHDIFNARHHRDQIQNVVADDRQILNFFLSSVPVRWWRPEVARMVSAEILTSTCVFTPATANSKLNL